MFYVYNDFVLEGVLMRYKSVKWVREYNDMGEFEIDMPYDKEVFDMVKDGTVIHNKTCNDWGMVLSKRVVTDRTGSISLLIAGRSLLHILTLRVDECRRTGRVSDVISRLLTGNFTNAADTRRRIPNIAINTYLKDDPTITMDVGYKDVFSIMTEILKPQGIGLEISCYIPNKNFIFALYRGTERGDVVFSPEYNNVSEQEYCLDATEHKNTCLVEKDEMIITVGWENEGLDRKEIYTSASSDSAADTGRTELAQYMRIETLETVIDSESPQFEYLKDWNLGDVVMTKNNALGVTMRMRVQRIEEFFDETGKHITVTFGAI